MELVGWLRWNSAVCHPEFTDPHEGVPVAATSLWQAAAGGAGLRRRPPTAAFREAQSSSDGQSALPGTFLQLAGIWVGGGKEAIEPNPNKRTANEALKICHILTKRMVQKPHSWPWFTVANKI